MPNIPTDTQRAPEPPEPRSEPDTHRDGAPPPRLRREPHPYRDLVCSECGRSCEGHCLFD